MSAKNGGKGSGVSLPGLEGAEPVWSSEEWEPPPDRPAPEHEQVDAYIHEMTLELADLARKNGDLELSDRLIGAVGLKRPSDN
ncbi:MAG TPA: hypothetical protein VL358_11665 [Caulobacteraceae bacterium]|jgi:hypothetical protein|nr:hypothetical protein [Caulobacteraceae bacterium]